MTDQLRTRDLIGQTTAEVALLGITLATAIGMARLFTSGDFLWRIIVVIVVAHVLNAAIRHLRWPGWIAALVILASGVLTISWLYLGDTMTFGVPTGATLDLVRSVLQEAFAPFNSLVAPVEITAGFELTLAAAAWILATFADAAAFRGEAPVQAVIPCLASFLFTSILAAGNGELGATMLMLLALGAWAAAWHAWIATRQRWVEDRPRQGSRDLLRRGLAMTAVATIVAVAIGPYLPAQRSTALVDLRRLGQGSPNRVADNPLVGVGSLLRDQSNEPLFEVTSAAGHYWRLTSLEEFDSDRQVWFSNQKFSDVSSGPLPDPDGEPRRGDDDNEPQEFRITGLRGIWLPAAYAPRTIDVRGDTRYSAESASLIAGEGSVQAGLRYRIASRLPSGADVPRSFDARVDPALLEVPTEMRPQLESLARDIVARAGATGDAAATARALQDWFRNNFSYDATADYSATPDPTASFLRNRIGFCQQFASTFALMARALGIPARVAVGFTYGTPVRQGDDGDVTFSVRARQAHAWPEVLISGVGWRPYEPTPTRGNPDATAWTGVASAQDDGTGGDAVPTTTAPATTVGATTTVPTSPSTTATRPQERDATATPPSRRGRQWWATVLLTGAWALVVAVALVLARVGALRWKRSRRRRRATTPAAQVALAWIEANSSLASTSLRRRPSETIEEFVDRVGTRFPIDGLRQLGNLEVGRIYSAEPLGSDDAESARLVADRVEATVVASLGARARWTHALAIRPRV